MRAAALILITVSMPASAFGQSLSARFTAGGGVFTDARGVRSSAVTVSPLIVASLARPVALILSASGTRFATGSWAAGAGAGLVIRTPIAQHAVFALDVGSGLTVTSYRARYGSAEAQPAIELQLGRLALSAGAHAGYGSVSQGNADAPLSPAPIDHRASRTALGPVVAARLAVPFGADHGTSLALGIRERRDRIEGITVIDRLATAILTTGRITLSGWGGLRRASDERTGIYGGRLDVNITPAFALTAAAEQYPSNRLLGIAGGRSLSGGIVLRSVAVSRRAPR